MLSNGISLLPLPSNGTCGVKSFGLCQSTRAPYIWPQARAGLLEVWLIPALGRPILGALFDDMEPNFSQQTWMRVDVDSEIEPRDSVSDCDFSGKVQWSLRIHEGSIYLISTASGRIESSL